MTINNTTVAAASQGGALAPTLGGALAPTLQGGLEPCLGGALGLEACYAWGCNNPEAPGLRGYCSLACKAEDEAEEARAKAEEEAEEARAGLCSICEGGSSSICWDCDAAADALSERECACCGCYSGGGVYCGTCLLYEDVAAD